MKNGKKVINEYKKELDDLLDDNNYDGENELYNQEQEEDENSNEEDDEEATKKMMKKIKK